MCPDGLKARLRISAAFPAKPLRPPVTCFRRKQIYSTITAIELHVPVAFATAPAAKHVQEFHLIPLFRNKDACPLPDGVGSRICHKSRIHIKFYRKVHATLPMQNSEAIPFKELSFVKLALYKWLSFEFIIQLSA